MEIIEEAACGDGPIDATFKAIDRATGVEVNLKGLLSKGCNQWQGCLG